ncbi:MAG: GTP 3',8-cyclase MoaA [Chloroflexi bacterium]|nr:GTP 3',8-cyclase MoaA [Chloroflexota bacterium]
MNYLRVSVTDRCNLRCMYCMPSQGIRLAPHSDLLSYEEIKVVVDVAAEMGISKVRISGGEPLVRLGLVSLVRMLAGIGGISDLSLTTNGVLLRGQAAGLREAGLKRVNVSLDSLKRWRFTKITGYDRLNEVLSGIERAQEVGLEPIKVNVVVMRGINDDELVDFAILSQQGWHVRFIELMPMLSNGVASPEFMSTREMCERLVSLGDLAPCSSPEGAGPAKYYRLPGALGTIGFISPVSDHFCFKCNRLRLTADGKLLPCLLSDEEVDVRQPLRAGASREDIGRLLLQAVASKPERHRVAENVVPQRRLMTQVGG